MGVGAGLYMCDVVVKSSRSLSHLLMSSCLGFVTIERCRKLVANWYRDTGKTCLGGGMHCPNASGLWATVCKTVRSMPSDRCLSVLSVCDVGALWPNGWMDQDETWHAGKPRPWPHCVRWGPSFPSPMGPQFSTHICCGQMAGWIKMSLGMEVGLGPSCPSKKGV